MVALGGDCFRKLVNWLVAWKLGIRKASTTHYVHHILFSTDNLAGAQGTREAAERSEERIGQQLIDGEYVERILELVDGVLQLDQIPLPHKRDCTQNILDLLNSYYNQST